MFFQINEQEWGLLFNEPPEIFKVYCALKRVMDYETGITGLTYRINDHFFREVLHVDIVRGRKKEKEAKLTRETIRSILRRLEKIGAISDMRNFVFKLNLATLHKSVQNNSNRSATKQQPHQQPRKTNNKPININNLKDIARGSATISESDITPISNPPQISNNKSNKLDLYIVHFEKFWAEYPRKINKVTARNIWAKNNLDDCAELIISDVRERKKSDINWAEANKYVPHPTTYLNQLRWTDEEKAAKERIDNAAHSTLRRASKIESFTEINERFIRESERGARVINGDYTAI